MSKYDVPDPRVMANSRVCSEIVSWRRVPKRVAFSVRALRFSEAIQEILS